ncbi:MAG: transcription termination/antitermination NusG family protein [Pseudomonadota bacterium]
MMAEPKTEVMEYDGKRYVVYTDVDRDVVQRFRRAAKRCGDRPAKWFVVQVVAGMEQIVTDAMIADDIQVWCPTRKEKRCTVRRGGGRPSQVDVEVAAFPGYLLVRCAVDTDAWHGLRSYDAVMAILGRDGWPLPMSDAAMSKLHALIEGKHLDFSTGRWQLNPGDEVTFTHGYLTGYTGIVGDSYAGTGIVPVLVDAMGRKTLTLTPLDELEKLN